jgi:hypothetical protein
MHPKLYMHEHFDLIINSFKYKCETSQIFIHPFKKIVVNVKCNFWRLNLTIFKVNDSTHVQMLMVQEMRKNSLTHSSINVKHWVVCVSIYISKYNMQHLNNGFNKFKVDDSTHVKMLIVWKMWKKLINHFNIIAKYWVACV